MTEEGPALGCSVNAELSERVECILTYGGSTRDIAINYAMLAINLAGCVALLPAPLSSGPIASFGFVWIFQIGLCLALAHASEDGLGCAGISIVWCAMAGWMWHQKQRQKQTDSTTLRRKREQGENQSALWKLLAVSNTVVVVYYWITEEFITTVAHVLALILGWLLSWLAQ